MRSSIKFLGVIDNTGKQHVVEFYDGVNVITGRSSTGKSAIIEIFDYCFGKKENTIPHGVITENAQIYFCVMNINNNFVVLARKQNPRIAFIRDESSLPHLEELTLDYFTDDYFLNLDTFRNSLNNHFNLKVTDTDEDRDARRYRRNNAKAPRASVRNFVSFMLQHQNLVANKHALFYRFDEKEKREQTIDQFKIFLGLVDQEYYLKKQELADTERELKKLRIHEEKHINNLENVKEKLTGLLNQYEYITGVKIPIENANQIIADPMNSFDKINAFNVAIGDNEDVYSKKYEEYKEILNDLDGTIHTKVLELQQIKSNKKNGEKYTKSLDSITTIESVNIYNSICPFCKNANNNIIAEVNSLKSAINWLNDELIKTPVLTNTFSIKEKEIKAEVNELKIKHNKTKVLIQDMENSIKEIKEQKSRYEQAVKVKIKIETLIQENLIGHNSELQEQIQNLENKKVEIELFLKNNYDISNKLKNAEKAINNNMNEMGQFLDFESTYTPVKLHFSLESFDLYFIVNNSKVYLRSVGSGANWLACHISLFTALLKYFCQQEKTCLIPPILFLDQPSQVYFPTSIDRDEEFNARKLKETEGKTNETDDDLRSVTNLYQQLVDFCKKTFEETSVMPQIIITDHADKLKLRDCDFDEDLVRNRRWRNQGEGFIKEQTII